MIEIPQPHPVREIQGCDLMHQGQTTQESFGE